MASKARVYDVENTLSKVVVNLGGDAPSKLVEQANERVSTLEGAIRTYCMEQVTHIIAFAALSEEDLFAESAKLGRHALNVADIAGAAGLTAIGEVANGINSLLENLASGGLWHSEALRLHLNSMTLISDGAVGAQAEKMVLERLRAMRRAIGAQE